jgi:hypothetical protein
MSLRSLFPSSSSNLSSAKATNYKNAGLPTRIDNCNSLKNVVELVEKIRKKVNTLNNDPQTKRGETVDYAKLTIMRTLLTHLDETITGFNNRNQQALLLNEQNEIAVLVKQLIDTVKPLIRDENQYNILNTKRNQSKTMARRGTEVACIGLAGAVAMPMAFFYGAVVCAVGFGTSEAIKRSTGLTILDPDSIVMVNALDIALAKAEAEVLLSISMANASVHATI